MVLNQQLYVGGGFLFSSSNSKRKLFVASLNSSSWSWRTLSTPVYWYALTHFRSEIVLAGGCYDRDTNELHDDRDTNVLLSSSSGSGWSRKSYLPSMPTRRHSATALNFGSPESLIVAGGNSSAVEVLVNGQWSTIQPLWTPLSPECFNAYVFAVIKYRNLSKVATIGESALPQL